MQQEPTSPGARNPMIDAFEHRIQGRTETQTRQLAQAELEWFERGQAHQQLTATIEQAEEAYDRYLEASRTGK